MRRNPSLMGERRSAVSLWRFRSYARPHRFALSLGVFLRISELLADLAQPWPLAVIVDSVLGKKPLSGLFAGFFSPFASSRMALLTAAAVASLLLALVSGVFDYLGDRVLNTAGERMTANIRMDLFGHVQRLPLAYHDRQSVGELTSRVTVDSDRIEDLLVDVASTLLPGVLNVAGLLLAIMLVNWRLGAVAIVMGPIVLLTFVRYTRLTKEAARVKRAREGQLASVVVETLSGIGTVHALDAHQVHDRRFARSNDRTLAAGLRSVDLRARFTPLVEVSAAAGIALLLWVGGWGALHGWWSLGQLLVVLTYMRNLLKPMRSLSRLSLTVSRGTAAAERIAAVLDVPLMQDANRARQLAPPAPRPGERARGELVIRDVTFGYGRGPVLRRANLTIRPGERVAILGPNGAGKSSLLALLARLYEPSSGEVLLDGRPHDGVPLHWLRDQISVVPQETFLFSGTLEENILYGRPSASREAVMAAAEQALVTEFVRDLPEGFGTVLGDRGHGLSGGQRQRVAIARALLRAAPIVLLDEPTSGLDVNAERVVVAALGSLVEDRTVVMVTHRPALLELAHRVVALEHGQLIATPSASVGLSIPTLDDRAVR